MHDRFPADSRTVPFSGVTTAKDIFYCFRLLLGRYPNPEEWRGHAARAGEPLYDVVSSFLGSLQFSLRYQPQLQGSAPVLTHTPDFRIYSAADDASVGAMVRAGDYEPYVTALFRKILRPGMAVLDLGANIGFLSLLAASLVGPEGHVFAVEPNPRNTRLLEASRRENGFGNITILQVAASSAHGLLVLNASFSNGTTSALPDTAGSIFAAETVPALRIDALLPVDRRIDLIKIDVEGAEYPALLGCEATLRRHRPSIITEFSPGLMPGISGIEGPAYLSWLAGLDYALSVITPGGTVRADIPDIMRAYEASQTDHIDLLAEPKGPPIR
jgi:FkbM family methyltransferase